MIYVEKPDCVSHSLLTINYAEKMPTGEWASEIESLSGAWNWNAHCEGRNGEKGEEETDGFQLKNFREKSRKCALCLWVNAAEKHPVPESRVLMARQQLVYFFMAQRVVQSKAE
jgi:hypothetical protein